jgi:hypothetical protein
MVQRALEAVVIENLECKRNVRHAQKIKKHYRNGFVRGKLFDRRLCAVIIYLIIH